MVDVKTLFALVEFVGTICAMVISLYAVIHEMITHKPTSLAYCVGTAALFFIVAVLSPIVYSGLYATVMAIMKLVTGLLWIVIFNTNRQTRNRTEAQQ